jgi:hypothetical protein
VNNDRLLKFANMFCAMATGEEMPSDSKELDTILDNLEHLETHKARKEYAETNLKHFSSGSSRIVYLTPDKTIVKLAANDKGLAQNKAESHPAMKSKYLNPIIKHAKNYAWIETHYREKITEKQFEELTGLNFKDFGEAIRYGLREISGNDKKKPKHFDDIKDSDIYKEMVKIGKAGSLLGGDLARISSFGIKDNHPILLDAGLSKKVFSDFYDSGSS